MVDLKKVILDGRPIIDKVVVILRKKRFPHTADSVAGFYGGLIRAMVEDEEPVLSKPGPIIDNITEADIAKKDSLCCGGRFATCCGDFGLGPDVPRDDLHSTRPYRFDLIDPRALLALARVMHDGQADHEPDGWRLLSIEEHLGHATTHIMAHRAGDRQVPHLARAFTRLMMAVAIEEVGDGSPEVEKKP